MHLVKLVFQHVDTLRGRGRTAINLLMYFGIPLAAALLFVAINYRINAMLFTALVIPLSIFSSLLFSLHMMIYTYMKKAGEAEDRLMGYLFKLYINVTFCILVSVIAITALFTYCLKNRIGGGTPLPGLNGTIGSLTAVAPGAFSAASSLIDLLLVFFIYFLLFVFLGTLFLLLARIHEIIERDPRVRQL